MTQPCLPPIPFDGADIAALKDLLAADAMAFTDSSCAAGPWLPPPEALLALRISTAAALRLDVADAMVMALVARHPWLEARATDMRYALQEAVGNAVVHGNLGLDSSLRGSLAGLREFSTIMEQRRSDPVLSARPIVICVAAVSEGVEIAVDDVGGGFTPGRIAMPIGPAEAAGGGMGLGIIQRCCAALRFERGGSRIVMTFRTA